MVAAAKSVAIVVVTARLKHSSVLYSRKESESEGERERERE